MRIVVMLALAGCVMNKGGATTPAGGGGGGGGDPASSGAPATGPAAAPDANGDLVVPNLIGKTLDEAQGLSKQAGFHNEVETSHPVECEGAPKDDGKINCQEPAAGAHVKAYTMIQVNVYKRPDHNHLTREDIEGLRGMTVAAARVKLKQLGHTGSVRIEEPMQFIKNCKADTVCDSRPESGTGFGDDVTFVVNKGKLEISAPPP